MCLVSMLMCVIAEGKVEVGNVMVSHHYFIVSFSEHIVVKVKIPIVYIESGIGEDKNVTLISADNYKMGYDLGLRIVEQELEQVKVAIILDIVQRYSLFHRTRGVLDVLDKNIDKIDIWALIST